MLQTQLTVHRIYAYDVLASTAVLLEAVPLAQLYQKSVFELGTSSPAMLQVTLLWEVVS